MGLSNFSHHESDKQMDLEAIVQSISKSLRPLPVVHMSSALNFHSIATTSRLEPRECRYFKQPILFMFYGGAFYRPGHILTRDIGLAPIAFVFRPSLLTEMSCFYPFDTGAMFSGRFKAARTEFPGFERTCRVVADSRDSGKITRLIYQLFRSNQAYLNGASTEPDAGFRHTLLWSLHEFAKEDLTASGVDQRQIAVEAHAEHSVMLDDSLIWMAFPASLRGEFDRLCMTNQAFVNHVPEAWEYPTKEIKSPMELAAQIDREASAVVNRFATAAGYQPIGIHELQ